MSLSNLNLVELENKPSQDCLSIDLNVVDISEDSKFNDNISSPNDSVFEKDNSIRSIDNPFIRNTGQLTRLGRTCFENLKQAAH